MLRNCHGATLAGRHVLSQSPVEGRSARRFVFVVIHCRGENEYDPLNRVAILNLSGPLG